MFRTVIGVLVLLLGLARSSEAAGRSSRERGGRSERAQALIREGERLYGAGQYAKAATVLLKAQELEPDPRLTYNIARAYDQAGNLDAALENYQRYVGSPEGTDPMLLKRSALSVERLRGLMAQRDQARQQRDALELKASSAQQNAIKREADARRMEAENQSRDRAVTEAALQTDQQKRRGAFIVGGAALVFAGTGTVFGMSAVNAKGHFANANTPEQKQTWRSVTQLRAGLADAGFGLALAAAVTAVVLYPKAPRSSGTEAPLGETALRFGAGPGGAWVMARVTF